MMSEAFWTSALMRRSLRTTVWRACSFSSVARPNIRTANANPSAPRDASPCTRGAAMNDGAMLAAMASCPRAMPVSAHTRTIRQARAPTSPTTSCTRNM